MKRIPTRFKRDHETERVMPPPGRDDLDRIYSALTDVMRAAFGEISGSGRHEADPVADLRRVGAEVERLRRRVAALEHHVGLLLDLDTVGAVSLPARLRESLAALQPAGGPVAEHGVRGPVTARRPTPG